MVPPSAFPPFALKLSKNSLKPRNLQIQAVLQVSTSLPSFKKSFRGRKRSLESSCCFHAHMEKHFPGITLHRSAARTSLVVWVKRISQSDTLPQRLQKSLWSYIRDFNRNLELPGIDLKSSGGLWCQTGCRTQLSVWTDRMGSGSWGS